MYTHRQVTAVKTGDSTTAVPREQLCGHVVSPVTREHESVESYSYEKWEAGSWGREQFGNPEEGDHLPLQTVTKQQLEKSEKTKRVL
jgi:hypothetical protein